ncbi:hypothetical protein FKM82_014447 [Ascaphus truei]
MEQAIKYFQSGPESVMNGICLVLAVVSMQIYKMFNFTCPCLPGYNMPYGLCVMLVPPLVFFFVGIIVNQYCVSLALEYSRPEGQREKNRLVLRNMFQSLMLRAMVTPIVWIIISLLDGKPAVCAFSERVDAEQFGGFANFSGMSTELLLAKVPCKHFDLLRTSTTRKAISRFLKCLSQVIGWITVLTLIVMGAAARVIAPLFSGPATIQSRYWSRYSDIEEKCVHVTCVQYNHMFAEKYLKNHFENAGAHHEAVNVGEGHQAPFPHQLMDYLDIWYNCRPPIYIRCQSELQPGPPTEIIGPRTNETHPNP